jgi:adenylosuccinate synthase
MKAQIVVGLNFGDEGKGITTDFLANRSVERKLRSCVVRMSGGQQCGHTVIRDGVKHIYGSFGSGSSIGLPTYFSEHTCFYPLKIQQELKLLNEKGITPQLTIHPLAKMTTPFDCFANRRCQETNAHGTCGMGIGKTFERNLGKQFQLFAIDLLNLDTLEQKINNIANMYYKISDLTITEAKEVHEFYEAISKKLYSIRDYSYLEQNFEHLIFEGSQGIMLDEDHGVFPNVTWSNTTSKNAHQICDLLNIHDREIFYVTRAYHTRHGNGVFKAIPIKLKNNEEEINQLNDWQGEFKTSKIDYNLINYSLSVDKIYSNQKDTKHNLVVTCVDQIVNKEDEFNYNKIFHFFNKIYESLSPESKDFKQIFDDE